MRWLRLPLSGPPAPSFSIRRGSSPVGSPTVDERPMVASTIEDTDSTLHSLTDDDTDGCCCATGEAIGRNDLGHESTRMNTNNCSVFIRVHLTDFFKVERAGKPRRR